MPEQPHGPDCVEELRRAAETVRPGPVPVDELIQRGRALRARRRRLTVAGASTTGVLAVALAAGLAWLPTDAGPPAGGTPTATFPVPQPDPVVPGAPREVAPYEPVVINEHYVLGLLPEGNQNYVTASAEQFEASIDYARQLPGNNLNPDSISVGHAADAGVPLLVAGVWRLAEPPSRIVVEPAGQRTGYPATLVTLGGQPDWGTFYLDATRHPDLAAGFRVVAYDADGAVFDEVSVDPDWPSTP
ncbi:hypothetical protein RM844_30725 [Streptomyces sp. DSM 44915]|uniref:Uncharacterized protein n=1 Tax=Streptomyces chisholmiae TaxID=3075540 RepID=A0ABU2K074_9ACTN|nr:hypothetical protein [Streptomyces sp. DSM 44915]MDT0270656.1 hypothetical protein [Streptomyces sp. DSM 44915]